MSSIASVKAAIMTNIARVKVVSPSRVTVKVGPSGPVGPMAVGAGTGDMQSPTYDPQSIVADAFDRANHTGEQAISTVTGLQGALDGKAADTHDHDSDYEAIGAVSAHEGTYDHSRIPSADEAAAITGANGPAAGNVFATMADIGSSTGGTFPFYKSSGLRDDINITVGNELPFFKSNGAQDNISLVV